MSVLISSIITVLSIFIFLGLACYAYLPSNRAKWEQASRIPLEEANEVSSALPTPDSKLSIGESV